MNDSESLPDYPKTEEDLQRWITDGVEESTTLDYKRAAALSKSSTDEVAKDVSAFANSAGGIIIYGVAESSDPMRKHLPERIDPVDGTQFTKEWLERAISGGIRPRLIGVLVHPIRLKSSVTTVVYVVVIPQGETAHQALGPRRYYRRFNFESCPMEDHEIRDTMNRVVHGRVRLAFTISEAKARSDMPIHRDDTRYLWLDVTAHNVGRKSVQHAMGKIYLPLELAKNSTGDFAEISAEYVGVFRFNIASPSRSGFPIPHQITDPLLPEMERSIMSVKLGAADQPLPEAYVRYIIHVDDAPAYRGTVALASIERLPFSGLPHVPKDSSFDRM